MLDTTWEQRSDSLLVGLLLTLSGGYMDVYTYLCRGQVFAFAETGNMILCGINLMEGNLSSALKYGVQVIAFALGILLCEKIHQSQKEKEKGLHWRQQILLIEGLVLILIPFVPYGDFNLLVNMMIAIVSAMQMQAFRKCLGNIYISTMCSGNLRSGTEQLYHWLAKSDGKAKQNCIIYYIIIFVFIMGVMFGCAMIQLLGSWAILLNVIPIIAVFFLLFQTKHV